MVSAVLFGGTFLGIAMLSLNLGRTLAPERSTAVIGALTAAFGVGQIIGPLLAGVVAARTADFSLALVGAAGIVAAGGAALALAGWHVQQKAPQHKRAKSVTRPAETR